MLLKQKENKMLTKEQIKKAEKIVSEMKRPELHNQFVEAMMLYMTGTKKEQDAFIKTFLGE